MSTSGSHRRFGADELTRFLRAIDGCLEEKARIVLIGGSAAAIAYGVPIVTADIDTVDADLSKIHPAAERAREITGLAIPLDAAKVADFPYHYEDRLDRALAELQRLEVYVLERHDLALSKMVRGYEHDRQQIRSIQGLDFEVLVARYLDEMGHVIGDPRRIRLNFLDLIEVLFGELKRVKADRLLP